VLNPGPRWRFSAPLPAGTASGNQLQLEKDLYYPDSLGDLYGRVTELLGFAAGADEHKVQWLSTADDGKAYPGRSSSRFSEPPSGPILNSRLTSIPTASGQGGFSEKFYKQIGLGGRRRHSRNDACALGCRDCSGRSSKWFCAWLGPGDKLCVAGGLALNALLISFARAIEESNSCSPQQGKHRNGGSGLYFYAWNSVLGQKRRAHAETIFVSGRAMNGEENQESARKTAS